MRTPALAIALVVAAAACARRPQPATDVQGERALVTLRLEPAVALAGDARVLVAGGTDGAAGLATAALYDVATGQVSPPFALPGPRLGHTATRLPSGQVMLAGGGAIAVDLFDPATGTVKPGAPLAVARRWHTATRLADGRVLVAGGEGGAGAALAATELWDPAAASFAAGPPLAVARERHGAALLADGRVLLAGGQDGAVPIGSAELFDPAAASFTTSGPLAEARAGLALVALRDGRVLAAGGQGTGGPLATAELWDPGSGTWSAALPMTTARGAPRAVLLPDGRVLVTGPGSELFDPALGTWTAGPAPVVDRTRHAALVLPDGTVLLVAGDAGAKVALPERLEARRPFAIPVAPLAAPRAFHAAVSLPSGEALAAGGFDATFLGSAERFDGSAWETGGALHFARERHTATPLAGGQVLVAGGAGPGIATAQTAELFDPTAATFALAGSLVAGRDTHTATLLADGQVLLVGGFAKAAGGVLAAAERYDPVASSFAAVGSLAVPRAEHAAALLPDGRVLVTGGSDGIAIFDSTEVYDPGAGTFGNAPPMLQARKLHTATVLASGEVLVAGGMGPDATGQVGFLDECELFDPAANTWRQTAYLAAPRASHLAVTAIGGEVLAVGGQTPDPAKEKYLAAVEAYDPVAERWLPAGSLPIGIAWGAAAVLGDGRVIVAGGNDTAKSVADATALDEGRSVPPATAPLLGGPLPGVVPGDAIDLGGSRFGGEPVLTLQSADSGRVVFAPVGASTATSLRATVPESLPAGLHFARVVSSGMPSTAQPLFVAAKTGPLGATCSRDGACGSGHCASGVCCDRACDGACERCAATGACGFGTDVCRPAASVCDAPERCDGASASCPADRLLPDGTACPGGFCHAGVCQTVSDADGGRADAGAGDGGGSSDGGGPAPAPKSGCGCGEAGAGLWALLLLARARRRR